MILDPWQRLTLDTALVEAPAAARWAAREVGLIVARQSGKGSILEARELAGLFLFGERLIIHSAHEFKTAQEAFVRVLGWVENTDWLRKKVARIRTSHGEEGIELIGGQRLRFVARSTGSGRGFTGDVVILDEAYALTEAHMGALIPTLSARSIEGDPQIWYTSSAPLETSTVLQRIRRRGRAGDNRMAYLEWSCPDDADIDDPDSWYQANPGLGIRISENFISSTERPSMSDEVFARERCSISRDLEDMSLRVFPPGTWEAVAAHVDKPTEGIVFTVDMTPERTKTAIGVASNTVCGLVDERPGTGWAFDEIVRLAREYKAPVAIAGASAAGSLIPDLERAGVTVQALSFADARGACGWFYDEVVNQRIRVKSDGRLDAAVAVAVKKDSGDAFIWDRRSGDVCALWAVTLAAYAARNNVSASPGFVDLAGFLDD